MWGEVGMFRNVSEVRLTGAAGSKKNILEAGSEQRTQRTLVQVSGCGF